METKDDLARMIGNGFERAQQAARARRLLPWEPAGGGMVRREAAHGFVVGLVAQGPGPAWLALYHTPTGMAQIAAHLFRPDAAEHLRELVDAELAVWGYRA